MSNLHKALQFISMTHNNGCICTFNGFSGQVKRTFEPTEVTFTQVMMWVDGVATIQQAMPNLSVDDRELFLTGMTSDIWNSAFGIN